MKNAIVTGSARRVGRRIAEALIADGWSVLVHATDATKAAKAAGEMGAAGAVGADLRDPAAIDDIVRAARQTFGNDFALAALVNSASTFERAPDIAALTRDSWLRALDVNATAPVMLSVALAGSLARAGGSIVNISDHAPHDAWPAFAGHAAGKAALEAFTRCAAPSLADDGVRIVAVAPGTIMEAEGFSPPKGSRGDLDRFISTVVNCANGGGTSGEVLLLDR